MATEPFPLDEAPLRDWLLRAYHEKHRGPAVGREVLSAIRQFLSGPPGGESVPDVYWFEEDADFAIADFAAALDGVRDGLAAQTFDPVIAAIEERIAAASRELAPNLSVYVSSLAGALAVKSGLDETVSCALVAAVIIAASRLGPQPLRRAIAPPGR